MGQGSFNYNIANSQYEFPVYQYVIKEKLNSALTTWKNKSVTSKEILQSKMIVDTQQKLSSIYEIFQLRHHHLYLVSSLYLTCQKNGIKGCGQDYRGNIYYQTPITNLSKINDIPFHDSLHIYQSAFKGFQILFKKFGYFDIFQDMFYICQNGKLKVWCNSEIYKCAPETYLLDRNGRQEDMVYRIIHLINENLDKGEKNNMKKEIQKSLQQGLSMHSFQDANYIFRHLCREKKWYPPERLHFMASISKEEMDRILVRDSKNFDKQINEFSPIKSASNQNKKLFSSAEKSVKIHNHAQVNEKNKTLKTNPFVQKNEIFQPQPFPQKRQQIRSPPFIKSPPHQQQVRYVQVLPQNSTTIRSPSIQKNTQYNQTPTIRYPEKVKQERNVNNFQYVKRPTQQSFKQIQQKPQIKKVSRINFNQKINSQLQNNHSVSEIIKTAESQRFYEIPPIKTQIKKEEKNISFNYKEVPSSKSTKRANENQLQKSVDQSLERTAYLRDQQYTDPKLIEILSPRRETKGNVRKEQEINEELFYSFNKSDENKLTLKSIEETERTTQKKYSHSIDTDIWEDLIRLKKGRGQQ